MSDDEEESVHQEAEEQFLLVELPAALRKIRAKAKGNEKLARKLVFGKLKYNKVSFSSSHANVMKALDECFHVIVGKAADEIDKTRELLKELKREAMIR
jgi:alpha-N-acetylglucosamine transferase